jgi:hypothetical protein
MIVRGTFSALVSTVILTAFAGFLLPNLAERGSLGEALVMAVALTLAVGVGAWDARGVRPPESTSQGPPIVEQDRVRAVLRWIALACLGIAGVLVVVFVVLSGDLNYLRADVRAIRQLGGRVTVDRFGTRQVTGVMLYDLPVTDADLVHLEGLTELRDLDLGKTKITDAGLTQLKALTKLERLNLMDTRLTDAGMKDLAEFRQLIKLDLGFVPITDAGLIYVGRLTTLRELALGATMTTDAGLKHLEGLRELRSLVILGTKITPAGAKDFQRKRPGCRILGP